MTGCYFIVLLFSGLIGFLTASLLIRLVLHWVLPLQEGKIKGMLLSLAVNEVGEGRIGEKFENIDLAAEVAPLLDIRLDGLIEKYRTQIPMIGMFLTGPLVVKLKSTAMDEILQALPEIKQNLMTKIDDEFDLKAILEEKIKGFHFTRLFSHLEQKFRKELWQLKGFSTLIGLSIGLLEVFFLLSWIC